jgi:hypothetical protein
MSADVVDLISHTGEDLPPLSTTNFQGGKDDEANGLIKP